MCSEECLISWSDHHRCVVGVFGRFLAKDILVDCTIAAEGKCLKAHRLVLSACSPYFELLFNQEKNEDKVVVLEDLKFEELKSLIVFVYQGQVTVPKERLRDFVSAAESLQIKGLPSELVNNEMPIWENGEINIAKVDFSTSGTVGQEYLSKKTPVDTASTPHFVPEISHSDIRVKPIKVCLEDMQSWETDKEIFKSNIGNVQNEEIVNQDLDISSASESNLCTGSPSPIFEAFASSCMTAQSNGKEVNVQWVKIEESEMSEQHREEECKNKNFNESAADRVVEKGQPAVLEFDESKVNKEEEMVGRGVENTLVTETAEQQNDAEEVSGPLSGHISKISAKKSHKCSVCVDVFHTLNDLQVHIKELHRKERPKYCEVCMATFAYSSQLQRHLRKHTGERPFQCDVCKMSFNVRSNLTAHMRKHTGEQPYQCDVCKMSFSVKNSLTRHMRIHSGEQPFQCDICKMCFSARNNLNTHMRTHTGEHPFQCDVCKILFAQSSHLNTHMRKHTGERPYQCDVCQLSFTQSSNLTRHMRTHTGERSFQCNVCKVSFTRSSHLTKHMRTHTGERPYQCDVCKMAFKYQDNISRHMQKHRGEHPVSMSDM